MEREFLQQYLETGLFEIGDDDDRLKWLQSSIADLQKKFEEATSMLPKYTLAALDPNISDKEPTMVEAETIVIDYWKALRGKYSEMPRTIIRGVILNALNNIGQSNPTAARIICLTAQNFFPYAKLTKEKHLVENMIGNLSEIAEKNAVDEWALLEDEPSLKMGVLKVNGLQFNSIVVNKDDLRNKLTTAGTPGFSQHQNQVGFGQHFGEQASNAIAELFDKLNKGLTEGLNVIAIESSINKFLGDFKKSLDTNLKSSFSSMTAVERRSKLLWWKETLYSHSQKTGYRYLNKNLLPIIMAADLYDQVPEITPISIDYLLRDTLFLLNDKQDEITTFEAYLTEISKEEAKSILKPYFAEVPNSQGRISITEFISLLINDRTLISAFKEKTGIDITEKISHGDLSVAVLHDLLTECLIEE